MPLQLVVKWARASLRGPLVTTTGTNVMILASNALSGIVCARGLGPVGRGEVAVAALWSALISLIGGLGLQSSCSYHVAKWPERRGALAAWVTRIAVRQAVAATMVSSAVLWWLYARIGLAPLLTFEYMTWAAAAIAALYGTCYMQGLGNFKKFNIIRVFPGVATTGLMVVSAATLRLTPTEAGAAYIAPTWASAALAFFWLKRARDKSPTRALSRRERRSLWSYGIRSLGSFSGLTLNSSGDQLVLGLVVPTGFLGLYSVASAASSPLSTLVSSHGIVGLPKVASLTGRAKAKATWRTLGRAATLTAVVAPVLAIMLPWAIPLVYGVQYSAAVIPAEFLLVGATFAALTAVADDLLRAHGRPGFVCITQSTGAAVTIIGTVLVGGRPLAVVAMISSLGFSAAFALALMRLTVATRRTRAPAKHRLAVRSTRWETPATVMRRTRRSAEPVVSAAKSGDGMRHDLAR